MNNALERIKELRLVPVVTIHSIEETEEMFSALIRGGLPVAEICFRTDFAEEAICIATEKFPEMLVGAGTVINAEQCERAIKAGAKFVVSPGLSEETANVCKARDVSYIPGVVTPTEIIKALSLGLTHLKFFPAGNFGALKTIRALSAAFPKVKFMPTGGVNLEILNEYLTFPPIFACGGSWMMEGNIEENCRIIKKQLL